MATTKTDASSTGTATLTCPECGKTFTRPAAMGAHRSRVHGVAGTSRNTTSARTRRKPRGNSAGSAAARAAAATSRRQATAAASTAASSRSRGSSNGAGGGVNRDALLQTLFPQGIPAKQNVIAAVNDWLEEAERLSRLR